MASLTNSPPAGRDPDQPANRSGKSNKGKSNLKLHTRKDPCKRTNPQAKKCRSREDRLKKKPRLMQPTPARAAGRKPGKMQSERKKEVDRMTYKQLLKKCETARRTGEAVLDPVTKLFWHDTYFCIWSKYSGTVDTFTNPANVKYLCD